MGVIAQNLLTFVDVIEFDVITQTDVYVALKKVHRIKHRAVLV